MTKATQSNSVYTPAMEEIITNAAPLDLAKSKELAALFFGDEGQYRSVTAKATRMGVAYVSKARVSKSGGPVEKKEDIVADIVAIVGSDLDGLEKASKLALQRIRTALNELATGESE